MLTEIGGLLCTSAIVFKWFWNPHYAMYVISVISTYGRHTDHHGNSEQNRAPNMGHPHFIPQCVMVQKERGLMHHLCARHVPRQSCSCNSLLPHLQHHRLDAPGMSESPCFRGMSLQHIDPSVCRAPDSARQREFGPNACHKGWQGRCLDHRDCIIQRCDRLDLLVLPLPIIMKLNLSLKKKYRLQLSVSDWIYRHYRNRLELYYRVSLFVSKTDLDSGDATWDAAATYLTV